MAAGACAEAGEILYRTGELLLKRKEEFARDMTREMGKVLSETRGDVQEAIDTAYYMAGEGRRLFGQTTPSELPNKFAMSVRMPVGVCGMITPWNFPMAIPSWKIFPALVCGNTCVIKPAEDTPLSTFHLVEMLIEAGLPDGVVNIVTGFGPEAGAPLVEHPKVRAISFTGSSEVGRIVGQNAAARFKPCSLEMGGKNAMIVLDDANLDLALDGAVWGAFGTSGQRCTATSRVIVDKRVAGEFAERLVDRAKKLRVGNGLEENIEMGPQINQQQIETSTRYTKIAQDEGAALLHGGVTSGRRRARQGILLRADDLRQCEGEDAHRAGRDLRAGAERDRMRRRRRRDPHRQRHRVWPLDRALLPRCEQGLPRDARPGSRHHLRQRADHRRGGASALRRREADRQRPPRRRHRRAGFLHDWKSVYIDYSDKLQRAQIDNAE